MDKYEVFISDLVIEEIKPTGDITKRNALLNLVKNFTSLPTETEYNLKDLEKKIQKARKSLEGDSSLRSE